MNTAETHTDRDGIEEVLSSAWRQPVQYVARVDRVAVCLIFCIFSFYYAFTLPYRLAKFEGYTRMDVLFYVFLVLYLTVCVFGAEMILADKLVKTTKRVLQPLGVSMRIRDAKKWLYFNVFVLFLTVLGAFWKQDVVKQKYYLCYLCPTVCIRPIFMFLVQMYIRDMETVLIRMEENESDQDWSENMEMA